MSLHGGKFNDAAPETYLEQIIRTSERLPGPSQYQSPMNSSSLSTRGCGKISDANVPGTHTKKKKLFRNSLIQADNI